MAQVSAFGFESAHTQQSTDPGSWTTFTSMPIVTDPLESWQQAILGQTGKLAQTELRGGVEGLGASALIGGGIGGAEVIAVAARATIDASLLVQRYSLELLYDEEFMANVSDFASAWVPDGAPVPATVGGVLGAVIAGRDDIEGTATDVYEWVKERVFH